MTPAASSNALLPTKPESLQPVENHPASAHDNHDAYLVQVGSFRNMREAERMKAMLVMKGFDVHIASAIQQHVNWYRVIIGPFSSRIEAQQAQGAFARREHVMGMIRKMDA
jgi:cell division protein FtsN